MRKETILMFLVYLAIFISIPSSIPYGCGLISFVGIGSSSVARSKSTCSPLGDLYSILACGFTIAVARRYSYTDCFPLTYLPRTMASNRVPCSLSQTTKSSLTFWGLFFFVSSMSSIS